MAATTITGDPNWRLYSGTLSGTTWHEFVMPDWVRVVLIQSREASGGSNIMVGRGDTYVDGASYSSGDNQVLLVPGASMSLNIAGGGAQALTADRRISLRAATTGAAYALALLRAA